MSRCKHPSAKLVFEGFCEPAPTGVFPFAARPFPRIQIFQCPYCHAVQAHIIQDGRAEVRAWSRHPLALSGDDSGAELATGLFPPPPVPAGATILPVLATSRRSNHALQST